MRVDLQSISRSVRNFDLLLQPGWWKKHSIDDQIEGLDGPLTAALSLERTEDKFLVKGRLNGRIKLVCDRCLESYSFKVVRDFRLVLSPSFSNDHFESETELAADDLSVGFVDGEELDLDELVREQIYLALPIKSLCGKDCAGLCARCGANLNIEKCQCDKDAINPAFSKLRELKFN